MHCPILIFSEQPAIDRTEAEDQSADEDGDVYAPLEEVTSDDDYDYIASSESDDDDEKSNRGSDRSMIDQCGRMSIYRNGRHIPGSPRRFHVDALGTAYGPGRVSNRSKFA